MSTSKAIYLNDDDDDEGDDVVFVEPSVSLNRFVCSFNSQYQHISQRKTNKFLSQRANRYTYNAMFRVTHQSTSNGKYKIHNSI